MQALRQARFVARLVLAWFALSLGIAMAAPIMQASGLEMVCTGTGVMKLVDRGDTGHPKNRVPMGSPDCPLCTVTALPPAHTDGQVALPLPLAHALRPIAAAHIAARLFAPLPARGPPQAFIA